MISNSYKAAYKAAEVGVYQEIVDKFLHPYWVVIAGKRTDGKDQPLPDASEFERMARELVDSRNAAGGPRFTLPAANGGKVVRINEVKEQVIKLAGSSGAGLMAGFDAIDNIPNNENVHTIASAVERGVARGSSWWNVFLAEPLGTVLDLVAGFFTGTLSQRMGERFGRNASAAVQRELSEAAKQPGMESLLTSERVIAIGDRVAQEARRVAASPGQASQPIGVQLRDDIKPLSGKEIFKPIIETAIRSQVSQAFRQRSESSGKSAKELLMAGRTSAWTLGMIAHGALQEHEADAVEKRAADAFVKVVTDDAYRYNGKTTYQLSNAEIKAALTAEVGASVRKLHEENGWSYVEQRVSGITETLQTQLTVEQISKMMQASRLAHGQALVAMMTSEERELASREGQVQCDQGVGKAFVASSATLSSPYPQMPQAIRATEIRRG